MPKEYTYAVALIHAKESEMLSKKDMEQLVDCTSEREAISVLSDKGYDSSYTEDIDEIIIKRQNKMWKLISELVEDMSTFDVFFLEKDFHNLKVAVKSLASRFDNKNAFKKNGTIPISVIENAVKNRDFKELPTFMQEVAENATVQMLKSGDGGFCDAIIDRAYFDTIIEAAKKTDVFLIKKYVELTVALSNIKIAARGSKFNKGIEFFRRSLAKCETIDVLELGNAAARGFDDLCVFLSTTEYEKGAEVLKKSDAAFEKWCDNRLMQELKKERYNQFTIAPIFAYILACETEFRMVGLILTGKKNGLNKENIKERLRELYV